MSDISVINNPEQTAPNDVIAEAKKVKQYLIDHPDFLHQNPSILNTLDVPDSRKGSVSLVELQNTQLRKKVKQLSTKLSQLIEIAKENQQIYEVFADLNVRLLQTNSVAEVEHTLREVLNNQLGLSSVKIHVFDGPDGFPEIQQRLLKDKRFKDSLYFFGRLGENEKQLVFGENQAASSALVLLGEPNHFGMLAIGSSDDGHFTPDMDTLLLAQLKAFLNAVLPDLLKL